MTRVSKWQAMGVATALAGAVALSVVVSRRTEAAPRAIKASASRPPRAGSRRSADSLEMTFVGDVIFGRYRARGVYDPIIKKAGADPFAAVRKLIKSDLLVANLETPLVRVLPKARRRHDSYRFAGTPANARALRAAGFAAVSLANNHAWDMGDAGVRSTPRILKEAGVTPLGSGAVPRGRVRVQTMVRRGLRLGFISVTTWGAGRWVHPKGKRAHIAASRAPTVKLGYLVRTVGRLLRRARRKHDLMIVLLHWGGEYTSRPNPFRRYIARRLVRAGADLIIGHHPHVLQGVERFGARGLVAYSMGNFLFENIAAKPRLSGVLRVRYRRSTRCLERVVFHPVYIRDKPRFPAPAREAQGRAVRARMLRLSKPLGTRWRRRGEDLVLDGNCGRRSSADRRNGGRKSSAAPSRSAAAAAAGAPARAR